MISGGGASEARVLSYGKNKLRWHVACSPISGAFVNPLRLSCLKLLQLDSSDFIAQAITWPMRFEVIPGYGFLPSRICESPRIIGIHIPIGVLLAPGRRAFTWGTLSA